jgi:hypothetical protein
MSFLETAAHSYANKHKDNFDKKISKFIVTSKSYILNAERISGQGTKEECKGIYNEYKRLCIFTNVLRVSYLFANNKNAFNNIKNKIQNGESVKDYKEIYKNDIAGIFKTVFHQSHPKYL